jgi:hypothetical protein
MLTFCRFFDTVPLHKHNKEVKMSKQHEFFKSKKASRLNEIKNTLINDPELFKKRNTYESCGYSNPLHFAFVNCDLSTIQYVVGLYKQHFSVKDIADILKAENHEVFKRAVYGKRFEALQYLVDNFYKEPEYQLNLKEALKEKSPYTPLLESAAKSGSIEILQYLIILNDKIVPNREQVGIMSNGFWFAAEYHKEASELLLAYAINAGFSGEELNTMLNSVKDEYKQKTFGIANNNAIITNITVRKDDIIELALERFNTRSFIAASKSLKIDNPENITEVNGVIPALIQGHKDSGTILSKLPNEVFESLISFVVEKDVKKMRYAVSKKLLESGVGAVNSASKIKTILKEDRHKYLLSKLELKENQSDDGSFARLTKADGSDFITKEEAKSKLEGLKDVEKTTNYKLKEYEHRHGAPTYSIELELGNEQQKHEKCYTKDDGDENLIRFLTKSNYKSLL